MVGADKKLCSFILAGKYRSGCRLLLSFLCGGISLSTFCAWEALGEVFFSAELMRMLPHWHGVNLRCNFLLEKVPLSSLD